MSDYYWLTLYMTHCPSVASSKQTYRITQQTTDHLRLPFSICLLDINDLSATYTVKSFSSLNIHHIPRAAGGLLHSIERQSATSVEVLLHDQHSRLLLLLLLKCAMIRPPTSHCTVQGLPGRRGASPAPSPGSINESCSLKSSRSKS